MSQKERSEFLEDGQMLADDVRDRVWEMQHGEGHYAAIRGRIQLHAVHRALTIALAEWRAVWQMAAEDEIQRSYEC